MTVTNSQICDSCDADLPLDAAHYDRKRDTPTGFRTTCKVCRQEQRSASGLPSTPASKATTELTDANVARVNHLVASVDAGAISALEALIPGQGSRVPHNAEVYEALGDYFGGPQGVARHTLAFFLACKPGSQGRLRVLSIYYKLASEATKSGDATKPLDLMTDEELEALMSDRVATLCKSNPELVLSILEKQGVNLKKKSVKTFEGKFEQSPGEESAQLHMAAALTPNVAALLDDL